MKNICTAIVILLSFAGASFGKDPIHLVGSDLLSKILRLPISDFEKQADTPVDVELTGSMPGLTTIETQAGTLGIIGLPGNEAKKDESDLIWLPWAYQVAYVIVNRSNDCKELSLNQLEDIYSEKASGKNKRWEDLGVEGTVRARQIMPYIVVSDEGVVSELFKYTALRSASLKHSVSVVANAHDIEAIISANAGAIGISDHQPMARDIKQVAIASHGRNQYAYEANSENVYYGDYPMALPFFLVWREADFYKVKPLIDYLVSDEVSKILEDKGYIVVSKNVKRRLMEE